MLKAADGLIFGAVHKLCICSLYGIIKAFGVIYPIYCVEYIGVEMLLGAMVHLAVELTLIFNAAYDNLMCVNFCSCNAILQKVLFR
jgi:hypothetical protein